MKSKILEDILALVGGALLIAASYIIAPSLALLIGWLVGYVIELILGSKPTMWINTALGSEIYIRGDLPSITAVLSLIALFLRAANRAKMEE